MWVPGCLTLSPTAKGVNAGSLTIGNTEVSLHVPPGTGPFTRVGLTIGGNDGPMEAVDIEEALNRLHLEWVPVLGREATEPTRPRRSHFEALVVAQAGVVVMPEACLTAGDSILATIMSGMGILPAARNGTVLIRDVASFIVCAWNLGVHSGVDTKWSVLIWTSGIHPSVLLSP